jgi:sulfate-transporting ATPase
MSYQYIYVMKDLGKTYSGQKQVLKGIWLSFFPGAKIGVIGSNGSGKSTLLRIMAGLDKDFTGEAWAAEGVKIGYLSQEPELDVSKDVMGNVLEGVAEKKALLDAYNAISMKFAEPMSDEDMEKVLAEQATLQDQIEAGGLWDLEREIAIAMDALRCPPADADVSKISGGEKRRVALCRLLLSKPDMLLLDEPTNHLDAESVAWLERFLGDYPGTVVMITHDRYFLDHVTGWILELDRGEGIPWEGNYTSWLEQKQTRLAQEEKQESSRQKQLMRELEWVRQSAKARQAKGKARLKSYEQLQNQEQAAQVGQAQIVIPNGPRLGDVVLEVSQLRKSFGDKLLIDALNFTMPPGAIVGVIGPNGAGKTSLFRMLIGTETPDQGTIRWGETVALGYVDQSRSSLNAKHSVWQEISDGLEEMILGKHMIKSRAYCAAFNFKGSDQQQLVGDLSGGQRNRVHLAKMLRTGANVLLLDEPTNDLDVETLRALEEALETFSGCAIVISHDRWFLDRIATHILSFEGDSHVEWFEGNYADYEADRIRRLGADATKPKAIRYKKLV